ncbi:MAG: GAF domain-containing protein, partial [Deltaproteobacteria bacterium]
HFPPGQGLPGGVWSSNTPILMRDLGVGYSFIRAESAGRAGLTTGLGIPVQVPNGETYVLALLSARGTPIARRFEIWDARSVRVGKANEAVLIDGICARDGKLWDEDRERRIGAWQGVTGRVLGQGVPLAEGRASGLAAGYGAMVALPVYRGGELAHIVNWFC